MLNNKDIKTKTPTRLLFDLTKRHMHEQKFAFQSLIHNTIIWPSALGEMWINQIVI